MGVVGAPIKAKSGGDAMRAEQVAIVQKSGGSCLALCPSAFCFLLCAV